MFTRVLLILGLCALTAAPAAGQRFYPSDPVWDDPDRLDMPAPAEVELSDYFDFFLHTFADPGEDGGPAVNVNTLGDVPRSSWYTPRHYWAPMSLDELAEGPNRSGPPSREAPWTVVGGKNEGVSVGLEIEDADGERFLLKFDAPAYPELASGAEVISTKLAYALGYHVPENYAVRFRPEQLVPADDATYDDAEGDEQPVDAAFIEAVLAKTYRYDDGTHRALASKFLSGTPIGPFQYHGTRSDDGNDIFPHEMRRELRGLRLLAAWINHIDARSANSLDMVVEEDGRQFVRHHLIDFGSTLGGGPGGPHKKWFGHEYILELGPVLLRALTLGFAGAEWIEHDYPDHPAIGRFDADSFEPRRWRPQYPNEAFENMDAADAFWMAKQIVSISDEALHAIVETAAYSDPGVTTYIAETLAARRDKIGEAYLGYGGGLGRLEVEGGQLVFADLRARHGFAPAVARRIVTWHPFDNEAEQIGAVLDTVTTTTEAIPLPGAAAAPFLVAVIHTPDLGTTRVYLHREPEGYRVIGVERSDDAPEVAAEQLRRTASVDES